jgi:hypothetical protein
MNNKPKMKYVFTLNQIEQNVIAPCLAFAQIFQLQSYERWNAWKHCECSNKF